MVVIGSNLIKLTSSINERDFVILCRDLLACRGHKFIRITDGPGDGGRDIHSLTSEKEKHLTQCKFHQDPNFTCSSKDVSELPMALTKYGYSEGLFITNSRISPQGKREYLDNYPGLNLDFIDGESLIAEILTQPLLKAIWFKDNESIARVNSSISLPIIIRRHSDDASLLPLECEEPLKKEVLLFGLKTKYPDLIFNIETSFTSSDVFEPYRMPEPLTAEEGILPYLRVTELIVSGYIPLDQIPLLQTDICKHILSWCGEKWEGITVKVGRPSITPFEGVRIGSRIELPFKPVTYLSTQHSCGEELDWFIPYANKEWSDSCDARVSESNWVRLFNSTLNCCLAYEIHGKSSYRDKMLKCALREIIEEGWNKSLFFLIPSWDEWPYKEIPIPDETAIWPYDGRILCGWFHWSILGELPVSFRSANSGCDLFYQKQEIEAVRKLSVIKQRLCEIEGVEFIEPQKARHIVALIGEDPFPDLEHIDITTADVLSMPETIPSPISPRSRRFIVTICWNGNVDCDLLNKIADIACNELGLVDICKLKKVESDDEFLKLELDIVPEEVLILPTSLLLGKISKYLNDFLLYIESKLNLNIKRATKQYWQKKYEINFGIEWHESNKPYFWRMDSEGNITPLVINEFI